MPPKKKANTFAESSGTVDGWPFKVYGNGLVKVGTANSGQYKNWTVRLTSFDDVDPSNCAEHKECVRLERISRELPYGPDGNGCEGQKQAGGDHFELPATQTEETEEDGEPSERLRSPVQLNLDGIGITVSLQATLRRAKVRRLQLRLRRRLQIPVLDQRQASGGLSREARSNRWNDFRNQSTPRSAHMS